MKSFALLLLCAGCGGSGSPQPDGAPRDLTPPPPFCTDGADGGPPPTLASVEQIAAANCALSQCHDADPLSPNVDLDLRAGHLYPSVVNVPASETCGGVRVVPGDPASSYLYHKVADATPCGDPIKQLQMPRCEGGSCPLAHCEIDLIRRWIASGAPQQ